MLATVEKVINIHPKYLSSSIKTHILQILKKTLIGTCSNEHGYILDVIKLVSIKSNLVGSSGTCVLFHVVYILDILKPSIGDTFTCVVRLLSKNGLFMNVEGKLCVTVPFSSMAGFIYDEIGTRFSREDGYSINIDDKVETDITMIKYEDNNFMCIGKLK